MPKMLEIDVEKNDEVEAIGASSFSGPDEKTWRALGDADAMVVCVDKVMHPRSDVLNDHS